MLEIQPKKSRFKSNTADTESSEIKDYDSVLEDFRFYHGAWLVQTLQSLWAGELTGSAYLQVEREMAECLFYKREPQSQKHVGAPTIRYLLDVFRAEKLGENDHSPITIANAPSRQKSRAGIKRNELGRGEKLQVKKDDIKNAVGIEKWELALVFLRESKELNIAAQDSRKLAELLMKINSNESVTPRFFNGNGSLVYGIARIKSMFEITKNLVMECKK